MANLYYREDLAAGAIAPGAIVEVTGDEARHAVRVSRLRQGERILVGDGAGSLGEGVAEEVAKDRFAVRIEHVETVPEPGQRLVLVQALAKGDRDERAVEQATEFGVDAIVPWQAARSVSRWDAGGTGSASDKAAKGIAKWARIAREASKQSLRARVPLVGEVVTTDDLCRLAGQPGVELVALHPRSGNRLVEWAGQSEARAAEQIVLVVGPEGGFADAELDALEAAGASVLVLGSTVLRTSSAGPAALAVLGAALGRW